MSPVCAADRCTNIAPPLQKYCSRSCAPLGSLGEKSSPSGGRTRAFYTQAAGERSAKYSESESDTEDDTEEEREDETQEDGQSSTLSSDEQSTSNAPSRRRPIVNGRTQEDENGTLETESLPARRNTQDAVLDRLISNGQSKSLDEAKLISVSLIDESVEQLRSLMLSSAPRGSKVTASDVNSACNCAKQIHNLIRLKLDILKESRK